MQPHTKIYMKYFGYGIDEIENLMGLCRKDHERAHNDPEYNEQLKQIHLRFIKDFKP